MNQSQFNTLFQAGDRNACWTAVENHIEQQVSQAASIAASALAEKDSVITSKDTALTSLTNAILAVKSAPDIDTAKTIAREATRNETEKKRAELVAEIAAKQEELDRLI